jgi:hypothetical protein
MQRAKEAKSPNRLTRDWRLTMSNKKMALKRSLLRSLAAAGMTAALMLAPAAEAAPALGAYNVNLADTSVSGLSASWPRNWA